MGIVRRCPPERLEKAVGAAVREGISVVEITLDSLEAATQIAAVRDAFSEVLVGAGTVRSVEELDQALGAGSAVVRRSWMTDGDARSIGRAIAVLREALQ